MSSPSRPLAQRRRTLIAQADLHRAALAATLNGLEREVAVADAVVATVRRVHRHRVLLGAAAVGLVLAPAASRKWLRRAMWVAPLALEGYRFVKTLKRSMPSRQPR